MPRVKGSKFPGVGGRPKRSVSRRTKILRQISESHTRPGRTPLDIMMKNMLFYSEEADRVLEKLLNGKKPTREMIALLKEHLDFRMKAQACAVDAAPFVHARLASIKVDGNLKGEVKHIHSAMSQKEAIEAYAEAINAPPQAFIEHDPNEGKKT